MAKQILGLTLICILSALSTPISASAPKMQACYYEQYGSPDKVLQIGQVPEPSLQGADDVLIQVHAASINPTDGKQMLGELRFIMDRPFPILPGMDFSGVVLKKGEKVDRLNVGDRVFGMIRGLRTGTTAEKIVVDQHVVSVIPPNVDFNHAAAIPLAAITALQALRRGGLPYPPDATSKDRSVFISGGPGGVCVVLVALGARGAGLMRVFSGTFAIQLAKQMFKVGQVYATASTKKVELVKSLGADVVIDYTEQPFEKAVGANRFDVLVDCTGDSWKMMDLAKDHGAVISILTAPTADVLKRWKAGMGDNPGMTLYAPTRFVFDYVPSRVIETFTGAAFYALKGWRRSVHYEHVLTIPSHKELDEIAKFVAEGKIRVVLDQVFPLAQAIEAYKRSDSGKAVGKVVVEVMKGG